MEGQSLAARLVVRVYGKLYVVAVCLSDYWLRISTLLSVHWATANFHSVNFCTVIQDTFISEQ